MKPSRLYSQDYSILTPDEMRMKEEYLRTKSDIDILKLKTLSSYPLAVRHNLSLFPNNLIVLQEMKEQFDIPRVNKQFFQLIEREKCLERAVLNFINNTPAYHIVASVLKDRFPFGHHELYLFKEMWLGSDYRTDYVLIGKGSGGYEYVLIEFEKPTGRITLESGHWGEAFRKGLFQIEDWMSWMDSNFETFSKDLESVRGGYCSP